jgi:membrane-bound lytic murein transglycosylase D
MLASCHSNLFLILVVCVIWFFSSCSGTRFYTTTAGFPETGAEESPAVIPIDSAAQPVFPIWCGTSGRVESETIPLHAPHLSDVVYSPVSCPAPAGMVRLLEAILKSQGAPPDLAALPWIESSYRVGNYSQAGASGPWQFMSGTARHFNMNMTSEVDERYSWAASTRTASDYLMYLNRRYDDWHLALAAYNCGEGVVDRALSGSDRREYGMIDLPGETDAFVPRYSAALAAMRQIEGEEPVLSVIMVPPGLDLRLLAAESGIDPGTFTEFNRGFLREVTPSGTMNWEVVVPSDKASIAFQNAWSIERSRYLVKIGDTWDSVAQSLGVSVSELTQFNNSTMPQPGGYLLIPETGRVPVNADAAVHAGFYEYTVRTGDTLGGIGALVGVSSREVATWNDLSGSATIYPGQKLLLRGTPPEASGTVAIVSSGSEVNHTVQQGDTMWGLASQYGVSVEQIMELNNKDSSALSIGENLVIKPE